MEVGKAEEKYNDAEKLDDNPLFLNVHRLHSETDRINQQTYLKQNTINSAIEEGCIRPDNCSVTDTVKKKESEETDHVVREIEITISSQKNLDDLDAIDIQIKLEYLQRKCEKHKNCKESFECPFSSKATDIPLKDLLPETEANTTKTCIENKELSNNNVTFKKNSDHSGTYNLTKSKSYPLETPVTIEENDKDILSTETYCSTHAIVDQITLENADTKTEISVYDNITENTLSSTNPCADKNAVFVNKFDELEKLGTGEKKYEIENSFCPSETGTKSISESSVPFDENDWIILQSLQDCAHITVAQDMPQEIKPEISEKSHASETSAEIFSHKQFEDCEQGGNLHNRTEFNIKDFCTSLQTTMSNYVISLINHNVKGIENKASSEQSETSKDDDNLIGASLLPNIEHEISIANRTKFANSKKSLFSPNCYTRCDEIKTLEDALNYFKLSTLIEQLEHSLEEVKRGKKSNVEHDMLLKDVDKKIQKLSFKFHPDKVRNKGGTEEEIVTAQKLQAAINAVRTALNILSDAFLEDLDVNHRYGFYMKLELSSLANESEVRNHVHEVLFQISLLSEIKKKKIIGEIQKFLIECQKCIQSYFDSNPSDFRKHRDSSLFHLKCCIKGYEKLQKEFEMRVKECRVEKLDNICFTVGKMATENKKNLTLLRDLKNVAKKSLGGSFQIFTTAEELDDYFVLPLVCYVNVILMCSVMIENKSASFGIVALKYHYIPYNILKINGISFSHPYFLVSSFIDNEYCNWYFSDNTSKEEIKVEFDKYLLHFIDHLKNKFKECDYTYGSVRNYFSEELQKCMKMMHDFQKKEKEISTNIEKIKRKTDEIDEKYERIMKENEEINKVMQERMEKSKMLAERTSLALSKKF